MKITCFQFLVGLMLMASNTLYSQNQSEFSSKFESGKGIAIEMFSELGSFIEVPSRESAKAFYTSYRNGEVIITRKGISYLFHTKSGERKNRLDTVQLTLINANPHATIQPIDKQEYHVNRYLAKGSHNAHSFSQLYIENVYPGIDWKLYFDGKELKYDFIIRKEGNLADIKLSYSGIESIELEEDGSIQALFDHGFIVEKAPIVFDAFGKSIEANYQLIDSVSFQYAVKGYKPGNHITIDPGIVWSTYYGGEDNESEYIYCSTDNNKHVYLAGATYSTMNIADSNVYQDSNAGRQDIFIVKFNESGQRLWATYIGGSGQEELFDMAVDQIDGSVYISGFTMSKNDSVFGFNGFDNHFGSQSFCGFLSKFDSTGNLVWSTYYGPGGIYSIVIDKHQNVLIAGNAFDKSYYGYNGYKDTSNAQLDGIFAKFNKNGVRIWSSYFGGEKDDNILDISTDSLGNIYLAGATISQTEIGYNGFQNSIAGSYDGFLAKFDSSLNLKWSTYIGGTVNESGKQVLVDETLNIYLIGSSNSSTNIGYNGFQDTNNGNVDMILMKFDQNGQRIFGTYFGGSNDDNVSYAAMDSKGRIYMCGYTNSPNLGYRGIKDTITVNPNGSTVRDGFLFCFDTTGNRLWSSYFGGYNQDMIVAISINKDDILYGSGITGSTSGITKNGYKNSFQANNNNVLDAFLFRMELDRMGSISLLDDTICGNDSLQLDLALISDFASDNLMQIHLLDSGQKFYATPHILYSDSVSETGNAHIRFIVPDTLPSYENLYLRVTSTHPIDTFYMDTRFVLLPVPSAQYTLSSPPPNCLGSPVYITMDTGLSYTWYLQNHLQNDSTNQFLIEYGGSVRVELANNENCLAQFDSFFTFYSSPKAGLQVNSVEACLNQNQISISNTSSYLYGPSTSTWTINDTINYSNLPVPYSFLDTGLHKIKITITTNEGCKDDTTIWHQVLPNPTSTFLTDTITCFDSNQFNLSPLSYNSSFFYSWILENDTLIIDSITGYSFNSPGIKQLQLIVKSDKNCFDTSTRLVNLIVDPTPKIDSDTSGCLSNPTVSFDALNSINALKYSWFIDSNPADTMPSFTYSFPSANNYSIQLQVTDSFGCTASIRQNIQIHDNPIARFTIDSIICYSAEKSVLPTNTSLGDSLSYAWNFKGQLYYDSVPSFPIDWVGNDSVYMTVTDKFLCVDAMAQRIEVLPLPETQLINPFEDYICQGSYGVLIDSFRNDSLGWYKNGNWFSNQVDSILITDSGAYHYVAWSDFGCKQNSDTIHFSLRNLPQKPIITQDSNFLRSSFSGTSFWYKIDSTWLYIDSLQRISPTANGQYIVKIDSNGCIQLSDTFYFTQVGLQNAKNYHFSVYPNPNSGTFQIDYNFEFNDLFILTPEGKSIPYTILSNENGHLDMVITPGIPGYYFVLFQVKEGWVIEKLVVTD